MVLTSDIFKGSWRCGYGPAAENEVIKIGSELWILSATRGREEEPSCLVLPDFRIVGKGERKRRSS
jgi:hypothetical protein